MGGVAVGVTVQHTAGISGWEEFWIVVAAGVAVAGGSYVAQWAWRFANRPRLVIEWGDTKEFNRRLATTTPDVTMWADGQPIEAAFVKTLRIRETRGRAARNVTVRITEVEDPDDEEEPPELPSRLRWLDFNERADILPRDHRHIALQMIVIAPGGKDREFHVRTVLSESSPQNLTVEVFVNDRPHVSERITLEHAWPGLMLRLHQGDGLPEPFLFPIVRRAAAQPRRAARLRGDARRLVRDVPRRVVAAARLPGRGRR